jgi:hypothetical protein
MGGCESLRRKKGWSSWSKMACSWSLERDRSEWIGLRGCRVTGWGENRKSVAPCLTGCGTWLDRPCRWLSRLSYRLRVRLLFPHRPLGCLRFHLEKRRRAGEKTWRVVRPPQPPVKPPSRKNSSRDAISVVPTWCRRYQEIPGFWTESSYR